MLDGEIANALWAAEDAAEAAHARLVGADSWIATGVSIDTRSLAPGELFVALKDVRDGHEFVAAAFAAGASAALVGRADVAGGPLLVVDDVLEGLRNLARGARERSGAKRIAITGSVGKTSVKEALALCLAPSGATHAATKSFNNHFGVPLTLARMPPDSAYGVFEVGMNHRGEIAPLVELVRPHAAVITTVAPVHVEHLGSLAAIAEEKADIFSSLADGAAAIIPAAAPHADILIARAKSVGARLIRFGESAECEARLISFVEDAAGSNAEADLMGRRIRYRVGAPGRPWAGNALATLAAVAAVGASVDKAAAALETLRAPPGRGAAKTINAPHGAFTLVDDAYNASPVSIAAALETLGKRPATRRIAALGDMLELGPDERAYHAGLAEPAERAGVDLVFCAGPRMAALWEALPPARRGGYAKDADSLIPLLTEALKPGDAVLVKGSFGSKMSRVVEALARLGIRSVLNDLLFPLADHFQPFNLFRYISFRTIGAVITAIMIAFLIGKPMINSLRRRQGKGQPIRTDGPESHLLTKKGTPTMGGLIILISFGAASLLWADIRNAYVLAVLLVTFGFGAIGFIDDYTKVTKQSHAGLSGKMRLFLEFLIALVAILIMLHEQWRIAPFAFEAFTDALMNRRDLTDLALPFLKSWVIPLGPFFLLFAAVVIVGAGNAVNMTDGLDGLAIVPVMIAGATFGFIAYAVGNFEFARYLQLDFVRGTGELSILLGAMLGAGLGFLWYNAPPARIFMGDTGSLALGGMLGAVAVATKHEIVLALVGGLFVLEALSVMIQVAVFKLTKKRVFLMAPIHHHFEKLGWHESTVVIRFWIVAVLFALAGLATLKLR